MRPSLKIVKYWIKAPKHERIYIIIVIIMKKIKIDNKQIKKTK
jgi:hypothetical protein